MDLSNPKFQLNREIPIPLYYQVKRIIRNEIAIGNLVCGDLLPSEVEFCTKLEVSRPTVRQALNELVSEGLLERRKKMGTIVAQSRLEFGTSQLYVEALAEDLLCRGMKVEVSLLELCEMDSTDEVNQKLQLPKEERLIYLKRLWKVNGEAFAYTATYLSARVYPLALKTDFTVDTLRQFFTSNYKQKPHYLSSKMEAVLTNKFDLEILDIKQSKAALVCVRTLCYSANNIPLEYTVSRYRSDKFVFALEIGL